MAAGLGVLPLMLGIHHPVLHPGLLHRVNAVCLYHLALCSTHHCPLYSQKSYAKSWYDYPQVRNFHLMQSFFLYLLTCCFVPVVRRDDSLNIQDACSGMIV